MLFILSCYFKYSGIDTKLKDPCCYTPRTMSYRRKTEIGFKLKEQSWQLPAAI